MDWCMKLFLLWVAAFIGQTQSQPNTCPTGWIYSGDVCLYISKQTAQYKEALAACPRLGASLTYIHDSLYPKYWKMPEVWIGIRRRAGSQQFRWYSNQAAAKNRQTYWKYTPAPDSRDTCGVKYYPGPSSNEESWHAIPCNHRRQYICARGPKWCSPPWERMPSGKCVRRFLPARTWQEASKTCIEYNSRLVEIRTKKDDDYLGKWATMNDDQTFHMGVSVRGQGDDRSYYHSSSESSLTFNNWDHNEPSTNNKYRCGVKFYLGRWRMGACRDKRPFVCEKNKICPPPWIISGEECLYISLEVKKYNDAQTACKELGASLAYIHDNIRRDNGSYVFMPEVWIGIRRPAGSHQFQWYSSEAAAQAKGEYWKTGYPKNQGEECGVKFYPGPSRNKNSWITIPCNHRRPYICAKGPCPVGWQRLLNTRTCIRSFPCTAGCNVNTALDMCTKLGANLIRINNRQEDNFITDFVNGKTIWLGITDRASEKNWADITQDTTDVHWYWRALARGNIAKYFNWAQGQGSDVLEDYAQKKGDTWRDVSENEIAKLVVCQTRNAYVDVDIPSGDCVAEDLLALVSRPRFTHHVALRNGAQVPVDECGDAYLQNLTSAKGFIPAKGLATCTNGVWKLTGCREIGEYCQESIPRGEYPGWVDGSSSIHDRRPFALATYNCLPGYTRGDHKVVCQLNGAWSNPNCFKIPGYCKVPTIPDDYQMGMSKLYVGSIDVPCAPWKVGHARFWCNVGSRTHGTFYYEHNRCKNNEPNFCSLLPLNWSFRDKSSNYRWIYTRKGNNYDIGTTARVYKQIHDGYGYATITNFVPAQIICNAVKIHGKYVGRFEANPQFDQWNTNAVLRNAYSEMSNNIIAITQIDGGTSREMQMATFCKSITLRRRYIKDIGCE